MRTEGPIEGLRAFEVVFRRDIRAKQTKLGHAIKKTARETRNYVARQTVPVAFGELRDSLHVVDEAKGTSSVVASSKHAAAIERGSRPHMPPVAAILAWVKLRGAQGLTAGGRIKQFKSPRDWRKDPARWVAQSLRTMQRSNALSVDAPAHLAWAIAKSIERKGTKAQPFMFRSIPYAMAQLDRFVTEALDESVST